MKRYWGYDAFRSPQEEVIKSVLSGNDTLALMPTGGGKSLCYQIPALYLQGMTLVVSPLIALMIDQVEQLKRRGIAAACIISSMGPNSQEVVLEKAVRGELKLLYVSPERLAQRVFVEHFRRMPVNLIAVDEAHCISQWGFDFRPSYLNIGRIRQYFPNVPLLALTATATPVVVKDIQLMLSFRNSSFFVSSFVRKNLSYIVCHEDDKIGRLLRIIRGVNGSGIVYVRNRRRTYQVAMELRSYGISAEYYHAGRSVVEREQCQFLWSKGSCQVMVATNAFGMGIDKSDVRYVVHLDIPDSPEAYYQEAGRAGRDGKPAYCVLLYNDSDEQKLHESFQQKYPSLKYIRNVYRGICNCCQVPIGGGLGVVYPLDYEAICSTYRFEPLSFFSSLQHLQREGLLDFPEVDKVQSKVFVSIDREEVYQFRLSHRRFDSLFDAIFRHYGGIFQDFVTISEKDIARWTHLEVKTVVGHLRQLDAYKIIHYEQKLDAPSLVFTTPRVDADTILLNEQNYKAIVLHAEERKKVMLSYVHLEEGCRVAFLVDYFGEKSVADCCSCDLCRARSKKSAIDEAAIERRIYELLSQGPISVKALVDTLAGSADVSDMSAIESLVRKLVDERKVGVDEMMRLYR